MKKENRIRPQSQARSHRISDLATSQHGIVSRAQLIGLGLNPNHIDSLVANGRLIRVHQGVYAVGHFSLTLRSRITAASLACGTRGLVSHASAAYLWGILDPSHHTSDVHVTMVEAFARRHSGVEMHQVRDIAACDRFVREGIAVVSVPLALMNVAATEPKWLAEKVLNQALIMERASIWTIRDVLERYPRRPGRKVLAALSGAQDTYDRSPAEKGFLRLVRRAGLPQPQHNVRLHGEEVDFYWPEYKLVVEVDGFTYHQGKVKFEDDHERTGTLVKAGLTVLPVTAERLRIHPDEVVELLRSRLTPRSASFTA